MKHDAVCDALRARGLQYGRDAALMRELTGVSATRRAVGAGTAESFPFTRGGKQGAVETSDIWDSILEALMKPLVATWVFKRHCFILDGAVLTGIIWADNIVLFASRHEHVTAMTEELSAVLAQHGLHLTPSSLQYLIGLASEREALPRLVVQQSGSGMQCEHVHQLLVVGAVVYEAGAAQTSIEHRLSNIIWPLLQTPGHLVVKGLLSSQFWQLRRGHPPRLRLLDVRLGI